MAGRQYQNEHRKKFKREHQEVGVVPHSSEVMFAVYEGKRNEAKSEGNDPSCADKRHDSTFRHHQDVNERFYYRDIAIQCQHAQINHGFLQESPLKAGKENKMTLLAWKAEKFTWNYTKADTKIG